MHHRLAAQDRVRYKASICDAYSKISTVALAIGGLFDRLAMDGGSDLFAEAPAETLEWHALQMLASGAREALKPWVHEALTDGRVSPEAAPLTPKEGRPVNQKVSSSRA